MRVDALAQPGDAHQPLAAAGCRRSPAGGSSWCRSRWRPRPSRDRRAQPLGDPPADGVVAAGQVPGVVGVQALHAAAGAAHAAARAGARRGPAGGPRRARRRSARGRRPARRGRPRPRPRRTPPAASSRLTASRSRSPDQPVAGRHRRAVVRGAARCGSRPGARRRRAPRPRTRPWGGRPSSSATAGRVVSHGGACGAAQPAAISSTADRDAGPARLATGAAGGVEQVDGSAGADSILADGDTRRACPLARHVAGVGAWADSGAGAPARTRAGSRRARRPRGRRRTGRAAWRSRRPARPRPNWATLPVTVRSVTTRDRGAVAVGVEGGGDGGVGVALAPGLAALGPQHGPAGASSSRSTNVAAPLYWAVIGPDLHLDDAAVLVALDLLELGAGHARRDALDVGEHRPRLRRRGTPTRNSLVSSIARGPPRVSTSAGSPVARYLRDQVGPFAASARGPPRRRSVGQQRPHRGGQAHRGAPRARRRWPPRSARPAAATARHASGGTSGWSPSPTTTASWPALGRGHPGVQRRRQALGPAAVPDQSHRGRQHAVEVDGAGDDDDLVQPGRPRPRPPPRRPAAGRGTSPAACAVGRRSGAHPRRPARRRRWSISADSTG